MFENPRQSNCHACAILLRSSCSSITYVEGASCTERLVLIFTIHKCLFSKYVYISLKKRLKEKVNIELSCFCWHYIRFCIIEFALEVLSWVARDNKIIHILKLRYCAFVCFTNSFIHTNV